MGNGACWTGPPQCWGRGRWGSTPPPNCFSLQEKWEKEINALYILVEGCARNPLPRGRAEDFLVRNSSWEGAAGAAPGVQGPINFWEVLSRQRCEAEAGLQDHSSSVFDLS